MDEDEGLWWWRLGKVFDRSLDVTKCGALLGGAEVDSGSKRKLEYESATGEEGSELPFSVDIRPSRWDLYVVDAVRRREGLVSIEDLFDPSPWNRRHDSRCSASSDSRLSCVEVVEVRGDVTGTMAALGTARRGEWKELRRLLGRDRTVLRDAERG